MAGFQGIQHVINIKQYNQKQTSKKFFYTVIILSLVDEYQTMCEKNTRTKIES